MTARAKVNGKNLVYIGWVEEDKMTQEDTDLEFGAGVNHPAEFRRNIK